MLCPRWDLPIHRRGAISMASEEMTAVFDLAAGAVAYDRVVAARLSRLNAPFRRQGSGQESLPGVDGAWLHDLLPTRRSTRGPGTSELGHCLIVKLHV